MTKYQRTTAATASLLVFVFFGLAMFGGCSHDRSPAAESPAPQGTRTYKLDPEAASVRVSVFGVDMGTPDAEKILLVLKSLKAAGEFSKFTIESEGIEGGFAACADFSATAQRGAVYDLLRSIETDPKETNLSAVSAATCASQNP